MKLHFAFMGLLAAALSLTSMPAAFAQHTPGTAQGPDKYQFVDNIELKPGQDATFTKAESNEVQALRAAHAPGYYLGLWSITGSNHVLFFSGFDSFEQAQKNHETVWNNTDLAAKLNAGTAAEAPLMKDVHRSIYTYDKDLSLRPDLDISKMRFARILLFHVRRGHDQDFEHTIKLFAKAYETAIPDAHWAMFEKDYGEGSDNIYILVTPMESLSTVDEMHANGKKFETSIDPDQLQLLRNQIDKVVESSEADLFAFGEKISYVPDSWLTAYPDFWGKK